MPNSNRQIYCSPKCAREAGVDKNREAIYARSAIKSKQDPYLLYAYNFECAICRWSLPSPDVPSGKTEVALGCEFHHIIPVSEGGSNAENNLILLCPNCHKLAHAGYYSYDFLRAHTKTKKDGEIMREKYALLLGVGTYWIDDITINRDTILTRLENERD